MPQGYSVELCKRVVGGIQQQLGLDALNITWVEVDEATRFDMVTSGKIDLECGTTTNTVSRQEKVDFSLPIWVDGATFVVKADSAIKTHADLGGKKVAVMAGTTTEPALKRALANSYVNAEVILVKSHVEGLELVFKDKADAYASDNTVLIGLALAVRQTMQLRFGEAMFSYEPYGLMLRKDDGDFRRAVNRVLAGLYRGGGDQGDLHALVRQDRRAHAAAGRDVHTELAAGVAQRIERLLCVRARSVGCRSAAACTRAPLEGAELRHGRRPGEEVLSRRGLPVRTQSSAAFVFWRQQQLNPEDRAPPDILRFGA